MKNSPQHYTFENQQFHRVAAHGSPDLILTRRVSDASSGCAANFIDLTIVPRGGHIGLHTHADDNQEIYIIVSGSGEAIIDGDRIAVGPGHVVVNRPSGTHGLTNTGSTEIRLVVIEIPVAKRY